MSYYACTPDKCEHGWDDQHGGSFKKSRLDDDCPVNNVVATVILPTLGQHVGTPTTNKPCRTCTP